MEIDAYHMERTLNSVGWLEGARNGIIKSPLGRVSAVKIESADQYFNLLISLSEYSFQAFNKDAAQGLPGLTTTTHGDGSFQNLFHYDYSNDINYAFIYTCLANSMIKAPVYDQYCATHAQGQTELCLDCLERYRVVTRNLIPLMKTFRKDLCSIYFIDVLYDLIRFENRDVYAFVTYMINHFADGSSFKSFVATFGKKKARKLLKKMNKPFRRIDFKLVLKKYVPLLYAACAYCTDARIDCLDRVYDYMLSQGLSIFKTVPSKYVVVGYAVEHDGENKYVIDVLETSAVLDFDNNRRFKIGSHPLLESLNFGFYTDRLKAYSSVNTEDRKVKKKLRKVYAGFVFSGRSVFTGQTVSSEGAIIIGFMKQSVNTFQNFRLDIHIESIITNNKMVDKLRFLDHDKWNFELNMFDACYVE